MFKHLFIMIWNKRKQNFLLMFEILVSFLVLFAVFTLIVYNFRNYHKPMGFNYDRVWVVNYDNPLKTTNKDSIMQFYEILRKSIKGMTPVKEVTITNNNIPFGNATQQTGITQKGALIDQVNWFLADESYRNVLNLRLLEGRWFDKRDVASANAPVVINNTLREKLFGKLPAVGKVYGDHDKRLVIGVVEDTKFKGDYTVPGSAQFSRLDTGDYKYTNKMLLKVTPDADAAFEGQLYKTLSNVLQHANVEIEHLENKRKTINYFAIVPMAVLLIVALFLMINVSMGLFGVLWYNINKRKGEIGLRRAVGATGQSVSGQLMGESLVLATFSLFAGCFFAVQFPLLNVFDLPAGIYVTAIGLSVLFIYTLVFICSLYPGKQAAAIYPAAALHED
ncbi:ABC transporter permease [Niastella koreensis]|uniref:Uncharacterized protein n=2 Tax=Niastella koreensis TaxID=354356 RepID=G8TAX7_NIAKG|nr:FtsX-like permease family protein [Niastella koreensis]AEW00320.1 protein of unknown function DUF214 [Niastella koreensis GR20-10]OQP52189.1 ABC transporter permease [Niastella koreensis]